MSTHKEPAGRLAQWIVDYATMGATLGDQVAEVERSLREEFPALDTLSPPDGVGLTRYALMPCDDASDQMQLCDKGQWVRYDDAAAALAAEKERADEAEARVEELELDAGRVSAEFEGDLWKAIRSVVERNPGFNWRDYEPDGMMADDVATLFDEDMQEAWAQSERAVKRADAAEARRDTLAGALEKIVRTAKKGQTFGRWHRFAVNVAIAALSTIPAKPATEE